MNPKGKNNVTHQVATSTEFVAHLGDGLLRKLQNDNNHLNIRILSLEPSIEVFRPAGERSSSSSSREVNPREKNTGPSSEGSEGTELSE